MGFSRMAFCGNNLQYEEVMASDKLITLKNVKEMTGWGRTTIWKMVKEGKMPQPVNNQMRYNQWRQSDIENFIENL